MFNFTPDDGQRDDSVAQANEDMVGRIMSAEFNLAVQDGNQQQAMETGALMMGQFLANRFGR